jgi:LuxR family maltose regulon positive regulatory protein
MSSQSVLTHAPKLHPQLGTHTQVARVGLLDLLEASSRIPVAAIVAPPGYGKTTLLAQWAERDPRAFGWLTVDRRDNDPAVLLRNLAAALDRIEPVEPGLLDAVDARGAAAVDQVLPRLGSALSRAELPAVVVLDDVHLLQNLDCLDAVARLIDYLPEGSQLAMASRGEPPLPLARLRAEGRVVEVGPEDLAMDDGEASSLLESGDVDPAKVDVAELVRRPEGWPVALHFAVRAAGAGRRRATRAVALAGDDRILADYLQIELLSRLPERLVSFLTRCSVLERMSGPLCDAVLASTGSADLLESLARSSLLTTPLDRRRQWYRLHRLFRELLRSQLERSQPGLAVELTRRAAEWCAANDLPEPALEYAMAAGDADRAAGMLVEVAMPTYADGRLAELERWFGWFEARGEVERRWADAARRASAIDGLPGGGASSAEGPQALLRAALCRGGVEKMETDAELALVLAPAGGAWQAMAQLLLGISHLLTGRADQADRQLADAAEVGEDAGIDSATLALAERSILAMARGEWPQAEALAERARAGARGAWLERYPGSALLHAVTARLAIPPRRRRRGPGRPGARRAPSPAADLGPAPPGRPGPPRAGPELPGPHRLGRGQDDAVGGRRPAVPATPARPPARPGRRAARPARHHADGRRGVVVAHHGRGTAAAAAGDPLLVPRDRGPALPVPAHGEIPGHVDLPQVRSVVAQRGHRPRPRPGPARRVRERC